MPYSRGHRTEVRDRIVASARRLFNRSGFESVSIDSIMEDAGLTRGGFYAYFKSKSDLYVEALACFFTDPNWKNKWEGVEIDAASPEAASQIVRAYLSRQHFDDVDNSCPMVALPNDVARSDEKVRDAFNGVFRAMVLMLGRDVKSTAREPEDTALAIAALCVGGMVLARALSDTSLADRLRDAAAEASLALGGWKSEDSKSSRRRRVKSRTT
jgi:TetR/AcrR family transcriptional regulator, transcriptional repressor for nem operon